MSRSLTRRNTSSTRRIDRGVMVGSCWRPYIPLWLLVVLPLTLRPWPWWMDPAPRLLSPNVYADVLSWLSSLDVSEGE